MLRDLESTQKSASQLSCKLPVTSYSKFPITTILSMYLIFNLMCQQTPLDVNQVAGEPGLAVVVLAEFAPS